ncbi:Anthocyanin 5-aromatic acyltransferase [Quillaja saponaria]|uniref:Anthocyanin 5-aromatic acyltransferase n=1 Tax=Quillaja saponaria TaxID=32244 RepID=A0AAD7L274_QUISA|nr:Anthocyanin 5-aromatic acyltransferase [Quillaja saponaria]KAJ7950184.1 Anthocyanin 5-aromatic acyltransferase [Quillaja saponaria]
MTETTCLFKILEHCKISPAVTQVSTASLPLTFFDISCSGPLCFNQLFFYEFPHPTHHFVDTILPTLKHSLSRTLQHFHPLAGNLLCPPPPNEPYIHYTNNDSVSLTIAESTSNFDHIISKHPHVSVIDLKEVAPFVPKMPPITSTNNDTIVFPIFVLQITVFPNNGLCIGITSRHVIDARSSSHFMKSWAIINSQTSSGDHLSNFLDEKLLPVFDRKAIRDPDGFKDMQLRDYFQWRGDWMNSLIGKTTDDFYAKYEDTVKGTFVFSQRNIERLKTWVSRRWQKLNQEDSPPYLSKFVVTCAFIWVCFLKTMRGSKNEDDDLEEYFIYSADCRNRLGYPIPETYMGNCVAPGAIAAKRKDLLEEEKGVVTAAKAIVQKITEIRQKPLEGAETWACDLTELCKLLGMQGLYVTGSPNFGLYGVDFGFGKPKKVEMVPQQDGMALVESGDEEGGGIEVGLIFKTAEMEDFISVFERGFAEIN